MENRGGAMKSSLFRLSRAGFPGLFPGVPGLLSLVLLFMVLPLGTGKAAQGLPAASPRKPAAVSLVPARKMVEREQRDAVAGEHSSRQEIAAARRRARAAKARATAAVARFKAEIKQCEAELEKLSARQEKLRVASRKALLELDEVAGVVRVGARDLKTLFERSPVSAELPERLPQLEKILDLGGYPGMAEIRTLSRLAFSEMRESGRIRRFSGHFVALDGRRVAGRIARIGSLTALVESAVDPVPGYAVYGAENHALLEISHPGWWVRRNLKAFMAGRDDTVYLDFSGGDAVRRLALTPSLRERLVAGGILVWPILLIGFVALWLSSERFIFLARVKSNTDRVMGRIVELAAGGDFSGCLRELENRDGPVFRVLRAGLKARSEPREVLENVLEEAILKELPRLEKFLPTLQVLAAIAPLLGLLGTVTGMINTFQVITVYGAGDPRMMSGGISEALVTTMLGLMVAIPIILLHTWFSRRVETIIGDMEEKAVGLTIALEKNTAATFRPVP